MVRFRCLDLTNWSNFMRFVRSIGNNLNVCWSLYGLLCNTSLATYLNISDGWYWSWYRVSRFPEGKLLVLEIQLFERFYQLFCLDSLFFIDHRLSTDWTSDFIIIDDAQYRVSCRSWFAFESCPEGSLNFGYIFPLDKFIINIHAFLYVILHSKFFGQNNFLIIFFNAQQIPTFTWFCHYMNNVEIQKDTGAVAKQS